MRREPFGTERQRLINEARLKAVVDRRGNIIIDRSEPFEGICEDCGEKRDLRPFAKGGLWVCNDCGRKDERVMKARAAFYMFGESLPDWA